MTALFNITENKGMEPLFHFLEFLIRKHTEIVTVHYSLHSKQDALVKSQFV